MDGFEANKFLMATILALLIGMLAGKVGEIMISPHKLAKNVVIIEGVENAEATSGTAVAEAVLETVEPLLAGADVQNGEKIARKCLQCHTLDKGGKANVGPNLWGIVDNKFAHMDGFSYSKSLQEKTGHWSYENLNAFIHKPKEFIVGTKMSFIGLPKVKERADLIAYLRTLSDSPVSLPTITAVPTQTVTPVAASSVATTQPTTPPAAIPPATVTAPVTTADVPAPAHKVLYPTSDTSASTVSPAPATNIN